MGRVHELVQGMQDGVCALNCGHVCTVYCK